MKTSNISIWFSQIRAPFLILSAVLVLIGIAHAGNYEKINLVHSLLLMLGVLLAHISVNLYNEISDFQTGIDWSTLRTPFSGGSGMMQKKATKPAAVKTAAHLSLILSGFIGLYFCIISGWLLLIFMIIGGLSIRFYTTHLAKWYIGEFTAGLSLGTLTVLGSFYALTGHLNYYIIWVSLPAGLLTFLLLLLNEFPDIDADKKGGRRNLLIKLGKKKSALLYICGLILTFVMIFATPLMFNVSYISLLGLLTVPMAVKTGTDILKYYDNREKLISVMGLNVGIVILTDLLLAISGFIS